jgi:hypothetical protein
MSPLSLCHFSQAMTMLEATADANNRNAYDLAIADYRTAMNLIAGPEAAFVKESQLSVRDFLMIFAFFLPDSQSYSRRLILKLMTNLSFSSMTWQRWELRLPLRK